MNAGLRSCGGRLVPLCDVLTPNIHEAALLVESEAIADQSSLGVGPAEGP